MHNLAASKSGGWPKIVIFHVDMASRARLPPGQPIQPISVITKHCRMFTRDSCNFRVLQPGDVMFAGL
jgi:hypothetical protein